MAARLIALTTLLVALLGAVPLGAQSTPQLPAAAVSEANALFHRVMSPYCPGLLLSDCPSPNAGALRLEIKERIAKGERAADIERELYRTFGNDLRTMPEASGFGMSAWLIPPVTLAAVTLLLLWAVVRAHRHRRRPQMPAAAAAGISPDLLDRIEDELSEIR